MDLLGHLLLRAGMIDLQIAADPAFAPEIIDAVATEFERRGSGSPTVRDIQFLHSASIKFEVTHFIHLRVGKMRRFRGLHLVYHVGRFEAGGHLEVSGSICGLMRRKQAAATFVPMFHEVIRRMVEKGLF